MSIVWRSFRIKKALQAGSLQGYLNGAGGQSWTDDTRIFSPLLYHLSYLGTSIIVAIMMAIVNLVPN